MPSHRYLRPLGLALTLLCVLYLLQSLRSADLERVFAQPVDGLLLVLGVSTLVYTGLLIGVATGFAHLVQATGHARATAGEGLVVWGQANLAKYLPGNVLHFAGRQLLGARCGWPQSRIAAASLLEVALFVLLPAGLAALALTLTGDAALFGFSGWVGMVVTLVTLGLTIGLFGDRLARRLPPAMARLVGCLVLPNPTAVLPAALYFTLFFVGMALITWWLYGAVSGTVDLAELPLLAAAFLGSWLLGFVVPGAPGGIGVREGTFALMGGLLLLGSENLVIVAVAMRVVTLAGEGLLFLLALGISREPAMAAALAARVAGWRDRLWPAATLRPLGVSSRQTGRWRNR